MKRFITALCVAHLTACAAAPQLAEVPVPASTVTAIPSAAAAVATPPAAPARRVLFLRDEREGAHEVWQVGAGAEPPRDLGFTVKSSFGGLLQVGYGHPMLSPDGALIAYNDEGTLVLRGADGSPPERITSYSTGKVYLLLCGWSPDSKWFLFHQGELSMEDESPPLPPGVSEGFYLMERAGRRVTQAQSVSAFDAWASDSRHVLVQERTADRKTSLRQVDVHSNDEATLHEIAGRGGFGQLSVRGTWIAYVSDQQVFMSGADGAGRVEVTARGAWAEYQFPRIAPGGAKVAYGHREKTASRDPNDDDVFVEIAEPGSRRPPARVAVDRVHLEYEWESSTELIVLSNGELSRVGVEGSKSVIASGVAELVAAP